MNIEYIKSKISTSDAIVLAFLITFFCAKTFPMPDLLANGMIAISGVVCFMYALIQNKILLWQLLVAIGLSVLMFISLIFNGNASVLEILWVWCYFGAAIMLKNFSIDSRKITYLLLAITSIYGIEILLGIDATDAIGAGSGNNISTYILFYVFLIYIKRYEERKKIIYWPCLIAIVLSIWGNGRAGLLASIIMFILVFWYDYKFVSNQKKETLKKVGILASGALLLACIFLGSHIETFFEKLIKYGFTSVRIKIYLEYITNSFKSIGNFLLGVPMISENNPLLTKYAGNPHNAFLMLHAKYGIIGFSYVILMLKHFFTKYRKEKKYVYLIIFTVWFVRSMFDWTGFPGVFDVLFFYFLLCNYDGANQHKESNSSDASCNKISVLNNVISVKEGEFYIKINNIVKKIYGFFAMQIYKISSKKMIVKTSKFFDTPKMSKYHHIVSALRYVAIEEYYGENDFGMQLYIKANQWKNQKHLEKDLERFNSLIKSIETKGYNMNSEIYTDLDDNCFNGTHRLALCAWFGIKEIPVAIVNRHLKTKTIKEMKKYYNLSDEEFTHLEKAYQRMRNRLKK